MAKFNPEKYFKKGQKCFKNKWYEDAVKYLELAADQGSIDGMYLLGYCYLHGKGTPSRSIKDRMTLASDRASVYLGSVIGNVSYASSNNDKNRYKAQYEAERDKERQRGRALITKAAESGHSEAQYELAKWYDDKRSEYDKKEKYAKYSDDVKGAAEYKKIVNEYKQTASEWYEKAADGGHVEAQIRFGKMLMDDLGVSAACGAAIMSGKRDFPEEAKKAVALFQKAAEQGNPEAQYELGNQYYDGTVVEENKAKAAELYMKAAERGNAKAQYALGECYEEGAGVPRDITMAVKRYELAFAQGDEKIKDDAKEKITELAGKGERSARAAYNRITRW